MVQEIRSHNNLQLFFGANELVCKHCGEGELSEDFASILQRVRGTYGRAMIVTSCCRCVQHNKNEGGHARSLHVFGDSYWPTGGTAAMDIVMPNNADLYHLVKALQNVDCSIGFNRPKGFLHFDIRSRYTDRPPIIWDY